MTTKLSRPVDPPPDEKIVAGDKVHELRTHRVYTVQHIDAHQVTLAGLGGEVRTLERAEFDLCVVYGGEGMRVFGKVNRVKP